jgi:hypothetical protein
VFKTTGRGKGVKAARYIKKGTILGTMDGMHMTKPVVDQLQNVEHVEEYAVSYETTRFGKIIEVVVSPIFDKTGKKLPPGAPDMFLINEPSEDENANVVFLAGYTNVVPVTAENELFCVAVICVACSDIAEGQELLVHYGGEYQRDGYTPGRSCPSTNLTRKDNQSFYEGVVQYNGELKRKPDQVMGVSLNSMLRDQLPTIHKMGDDGKVYQLNGLKGEENYREMGKSAYRTLVMEPSTPDFHFFNDDASGGEFAALVELARKNKEIERVKEPSTYAFDFNDDVSDDDYATLVDLARKKKKRERVKQRNAKQQETGSSKTTPIIMLD